MEEILKFMGKTIKYPAIFEEDKEDKGFINVTIPDIFGAVTFGKGMEDAMFMAKDLLKLMISEAPNQCLLPHTLEETKENFPDKTVLMVEVEIDNLYRR